MAGAAERLSITYDEYLALERATDVRHEWRRGDVWAMAGGTPKHAVICANLIRALGNALAGRPCTVHTSDQKIRIDRSDRTTYPDVAVVCTKRQVSANDPNAIVNPMVIVEVLSEGTESVDRGEKAAAYRRLDSLREYVLVAQDGAHVEIYARDAEGEWRFREHFAGERFELPSISVTLDVDALYLDPTA